MATKVKKVKPALNEKLLDIDLDVDPTETSEGKEGLNSLVSTVSTLFKGDDETKKIKKRNEPSTVFGELGLSNAKEDRVEIHHLLNSVIDKGGKIKKQIRKITHKRLLPLPFDTPITKKIERQVHYGETVKDISKWEPIVKANREAPQLSFPLEKPKTSVESAESKFNLKRSNPLKAEVDSLLASSSHVIPQNKVLTDAEEKYLNQMSIEEARLRHAKLQKMRALITFQEAKLKRKAKIKSKKYHKMLKKEKLKKDMKDFEELKNKDPDAALEKLNQLDKMRALERASLKHLNSGKWAKQNLLRAKYDTKTREDIKEQMHLNKTLLQKALFNVEEEDEDEDDNVINEDDDLGEGEMMMASDGFEEKKSEPNPWLMRRSANQPLLTSADVIAEKEQGDDDDNKDDESEKVINPVGEDKLVKKAIQMKKSKNVHQEITTSEDTKSKVAEVTKETVKPKSADEDKDEEEKETDDMVIDPKKILNTKSHMVKTSIPDYQEMGVDADTDSEGDNPLSDEDEDEDDGQRKLIAEAFDEDDVVAEFVQDKREKMDQEQEKDVNNYLPGWGSWTGPGVRENYRKKRKFIQKAKKRKRQDEMLHNVIISENKDKAISKFMVKELPFNCKNVPEFETRYKTPIGPNWNPETQFRFNIEPKIITQLGKIIDPIDEKVLITNKPGNKRRPLDQITKSLGDVIPV